MITFPRRRLWLSWGALVALDGGLRWTYLAPRIGTARGIVNYVSSGLALWIVVRLLATLPWRPRLGLHALFIALPMSIQWMLFRSYGQFVTPTDIAVFVESPRVVLDAARGGGDILGAFAIFALATACAWLGPFERPMVWWRAGLSSVLFAALALAASTYWRASPSLEHPQPAFIAAGIGALQRATLEAKGAARIAVPPTQATDARPNIVLVIGESLAASHLSLYGYARPTTPRLQELADRGELLPFRDATVMGPNTRTSLPYIMTGLSGPDPNGRVFRAPTVTQYANSRGYHTAVVSAQEESWGGLETLLREGADTFRSGIEFATHVDVLKGADDLVVLERGVLPAIRSLEGPFFLVVHMDGSHAPYGDHCPEASKVFPEDGKNGTGAYDNTVRLTDEYLARLFAELRARDPNAWLFFTSDHGQPLGEGGAFFNHGYQSNVVRDPLLVFPPENADRTRWSALASSPTAACDLTPTILHLVGTSPLMNAPVDCIDWLGAAPAARYRVVSAYTPTYVDDPTMLLVEPSGQRALYDLARSTVTLDDGTPRPLSDHALPPSIGARLNR